MSEPFVTKPTEEQAAAIAAFKDPLRLREYLDSTLATARLTPSEVLDADAAVQRAASTAPQDRPQQMRGQHCYRVMYGHGNSRVEIATDDKDDFNRQVETFTKLGWV